jgi:hypothetical protein
VAQVRGPGGGCAAGEPATLGAFLKLDGQRSRASAWLETTGCPWTGSPSRKRSPGIPYTCGGQDVEAFTALFAEDGVLEVVVPGRAIAAVRLQSRAEIREWAARRLRERRGGFTSRHHQSATLLDALTPDSAVTTTMVPVTHQALDEPAPRPTLSGVYRDRWRKTPEGWKIEPGAAHVDRDPGLSAQRDARRAPATD